MPRKTPKRQRYVTLDESDRENWRYLNSRQAALCLVEMFNVRCTAEWLRSLPDNDAPHFRWSKGGEKRYLRRTLEIWARERPAEKWMPFGFSAKLKV